MSEPIDDEFTEILGANIPRVDLVGKAANGAPGFLLMKADGDGMLPADFVRDLVVKAERGQQVEGGPVTDQITVTGSHAAIAAMIANAPIRKATPTEEQTMSDTTDTVVKADDAPEVEVTDVIAAAPGGSTAESVPGSPDWEQLDADTALNAISVLARVKGALEWLANREATEAVTGGDGGEIDAVWDLDDAAMQLDCIIRRLAGFATTEQLEAEMGEEMADLAKAVAAVGDLTAPLSVLETYGPVAKAGRVLSSANESAIRGAVESLTKVLDSLPQAPAAEEVAKSEETTVTKTVETAIEIDAAALAQIVEQAVGVEKAKGDPMTPVYDENGKLVGMIAQADLVPIAPAAPAAAADDTAADTATDAPAEEAAPVAAAPAPAAEDAATIPGTDTVASPAPEEDDTVTKAIQAGVNAALAEILTPLAEKLGATADLADVVKGLQESVEEIRKMPDDRKSPLLNGGTVTGNGGLPVARNGALGADPLVDLRKAVEDAETPVKKAEAQNALAYAAIKDRFTS